MGGGGSASRKHSGVPMRGEFEGLIFPAGTAIWLFAVLPLYSGGLIGMIPTWAPVVTATAATSAALIAYCAFTVARRNLTTIVKNQRETTAKNTFRDFLKLCVDNPELAYGQPPQGKHEKYEWFVAHFLWAAEELLEFDPVSWRRNLLLHASYHKAFLRDDQQFRREDYHAYSPAVQALIDEAVRAP
jgi:hypothetical protein